MIESIYNQIPKANSDLTRKFVDKLENDLKNCTFTGKSFAIFEAAFGSLPPLADGTINMGCGVLKLSLIPITFFTTPKGQRNLVTKRRLAEVVRHVQLAARALFMALVGVIFPVAAIFQPKAVIYMADNLSLRGLRRAHQPVPPPPVDLVVRPAPTAAVIETASDQVLRIGKELYTRFEDVCSRIGTAVEPQLEKVPGYTNFKRDTLVAYVSPKQIELILGAASVSLGLFSITAIFKRLFS